MPARNVAKLLPLPALRRRLAALRRAGQRIVFTNGVFDLLHPGHVRYLRAAKRLGDVLVVGLNSDRSARRLGKGPGRPLVSQRDRAEVLAALEMVDYVAVFDQDTPYELIARPAARRAGQRRRLADRPHRRRRPRAGTRRHGEVAAVRQGLLDHHARRSRGEGSGAEMKLIRLHP